MSKLKLDFYLRDDVVNISRDLLGKVIYTHFNGKVTSGIITETEAYEGVTDKASHAYNNRRTPRTETMYMLGGTAYVYLCYGIHHLFNVVTNKKDTPHAVLIRAIKPIDGIDTILKRRKKKSLHKICNGPGTVSQGLGITTKNTNENLLGNKIWIADEGIKIKSSEIKITPRIGIDYAEEHALLPYRFVINI